MLFCFEFKKRIWIFAKRKKKSLTKKKIIL